MPELSGSISIACSGSFIEERLGVRVGLQFIMELFRGETKPRRISDSVVTPWGKGVQGPDRFFWFIL